MYTKSFFTNMEILKKEITRVKNTEAGKLWLEVRTFIAVGNYSKYKNCKTIVKLINSGYKDAYIAASLGIEEVTVRIHKRNISKELYALFGDDFFDLFSNFEANVEVIKRRVSNVKFLDKSLVDLVPEEITALISSNVGINPPIDSIDLDNCRKELSFLYKHSLSSIKNELKGLDIMKLDYISRVISFNAGTPDDRYRVMKLLDGEDENND